MRMSGRFSLTAIQDYARFTLFSRFDRHGRCRQMTETKQKFDAVAMMSEARDKISAEIEGMILEE